MGIYKQKNKETLELLKANHWKVFLDSYMKFNLDTFPYSGNPRLIFKTLDFLIIISWANCSKSFEIEFYDYSSIFSFYSQDVDEIIKLFPKSNLNEFHDILSEYIYKMISKAI